MQLRSAWDRYNPRLLRKQPPERDLSRCRLLSFPDAGEQIYEGLIRLESLRREARQGAAEVRTVELRVFVDLPREKASAQRAVREKPGSEFIQGRYHFLFRSPHPQRVFALERSERLDCMRATDRLYARFGKAEMFDFALLNQIFHCSRYVFDWHVRVDPVLIEQVDYINLEPFERALGGL